MDPTILASTEQTAAAASNSPSAATAATEAAGASMHAWLLDQIKSGSPELYKTLSYPVPGTKNTVLDWSVTLITILAAMAVFMLIRRLVITRIKSLASRTVTKWDDVLVDVLLDLKWVLFLPLAVLIGTAGLQLSLTMHMWIRGITVICLSLQLILSSRLLIDFALRRLIERSTHDGRPDPAVETSMGVLRFISLVIVSALAVLVALDNLNVQVTPLLASMGIGGIAVALAAQNILGDLFASMTILFDKPFVVGDAIRVGDKEGTVEKIGIKTTRLRAPSGEQLIFSNIELTRNCVHNFKRLQERRIAFTIGVPYTTAADKLREVPGIVQAAVERRKATRFDRSHLKSLNAYSIDFETVYFMLTSDYRAYMDAQQAINLEVLEEFRKRGIDFAMPTQVAIAQQMEAKPPAMAKS